MNYSYAQQDFYLSAKKVIKNDKDNIILAQEDVEISHNQIKINADSLKYDLRKEELLLKGNIKILYEATGDVVFAEKALLNKNLKDGIIQSLGVLMADDSRLVASSANKVRNKNKTIYNNISYSKCNNCDDENDDSIFWKINAKKATHLEKSKVILYEDLVLEILDLPVLYFPFFYHPDPTVQRKTGLLSPSFSSSTIFGYSYEQPIFINLSTNADLTVEPKLTEKEGLLLKSGYRKNFNSGQLHFKSSITRGTKERLNEQTKKENRGHIDINFANNIGSGFVAGGNIKRASDKSYLSRYEISDGETLLTQNLYLEKINTFQSFSGQAIKFQTLSDDYLEDNLPFIKPALVYNWNNLWNSKRKRNHETQLKFQSISKKNNSNFNSLHLHNDSEKSYLIDNILLKNNLSLDLDFYNRQQNQHNNQNIFRLFPSVSMTSSYPMIKYTRRKSILFEPIAKIIYTQDDNKLEKITNEDSLEVELLSSNFLSENRYSGEDRKEHGLRLGYGMQLQFNNDNGSLNKLLLGRTYHNEKQDQFNYINGFEDNHSDIVGNYSLLTGNKSSLYYDFRISEDFSLNRNRLKTNFDFDKSKVNVNYIQVKNFASRNNPDTEQISYGFEKEIFNNWSANFNQHRDLAGASFSTPFRTDLGLIFENECAKISINVSRDKSYDIDIPSTTNYNFNINLF